MCDKNLSVKKMGLAKWWEKQIEESKRLSDNQKAKK